MHTHVCDLLGIDVPIGNAGIGFGGAGPELVSAVAEAGGLGTLGGMTFDGADDLRRMIHETRERTDRPFSVNLWAFVVGGPLRPLFDVCLEERVDSVTLTFGDPTPFVGVLHDAGIKVIHQAQSIAGARQAVAAGVDVLIAQGGEAGGHTGTVGTVAFVPQAVDIAGSVPVLAAGGIADGRGLVAMLALGAQGVLMGTRFVASPEAHAPNYRQRERILEATADDTVLTDVFDVLLGGRFPDGIVSRTIRTPFTDEWHGRSDDLPDHRREILAESGVPGRLPERAQPALAGQSAGLVNDIRSAAQIVHDVIAEAEAVLATLGHAMNRDA